MTFGRVIALEGASASGKTTVARRLGVSLNAVVLPETYRELRPRPSLNYSSRRDLERLEERLLDAEADRWTRAMHTVATGRWVILDTGPFGPLSYTYGLVREREAPVAVLRPLLRYARRLARNGRLGLPALTVYLDVPYEERVRRALHTPREHPPGLFARHQRVARHERRLLLGAWREALRIHRLRIPARTGSSAVAREVRGILRTLPVAPPTTAADERTRALSLLRAMTALAAEGGRTRPRRSDGRAA